jgi:hypothetical protein
LFGREHDHLYIFSGQSELHSLKGCLSCDAGRSSFNSQVACHRGSIQRKEMRKSGSELIIITGKSLTCSFARKHGRTRTEESLTRGAEPFLRSCQLCSYSRTFQHFMEPEGSLPCSQEPPTGPYTQPDQSNPYHTIL